MLKIKKLIKTISFISFILLLTNSSFAKTYKSEFCAPLSNTHILQNNAPQAHGQNFAPNKLVKVKTFEGLQPNYNQEMTRGQQLKPVVLEWILKADLIEHLVSLSNNENTGHDEIKAMIECAADLTLQLFNINYSLDANSVHLIEGRNSLFPDENKRRFAFQLSKKDSTSKSKFVNVKLLKGVKVGKINHGGFNFIIGVNQSPNISYTVLNIYIRDFNSFENLDYSEE